MKKQTVLIFVKKKKKNIYPLKHKIQLIKTSHHITIFYFLIVGHKIHNKAGDDGHLKCAPKGKSIVAQAGSIIWNQG